jgi:hypothetical protein
MQPSRQKLASGGGSGWSTGGSSRAGACLFGGVELTAVAGRGQAGSPGTRPASVPHLRLRLGLLIEKTNNQSSGLPFLSSTFGCVGRLSCPRQSPSSPSLPWCSDPRLQKACALWLKGGRYRLLRPPSELSSQNPDPTGTRAAVGRCGCCPDRTGHLIWRLRAAERARPGCACPQW